MEVPETPLNPASRESSLHELLVNSPLSELEFGEEPGEQSPVREIDL